MYGGTATGDVHTKEDLEAYNTFHFKFPRRGKRLNVVGIVLSLFIPIVIFAVISQVMLKYRYKHPTFTLIVVLLCLAVVLYLGYLAWRSIRDKNSSIGEIPSWYIFLFLTSLLGFLLALLLGQYVFVKFLSPYYSTSELSVYGGGGVSGGDNGVSDEAVYNAALTEARKKGYNTGTGTSTYYRSGNGTMSTYPNIIGPESKLFGLGGINPALYRGSAVMDAAAIYFAFGTYVDTSKAMSFGDSPSYCVAPITLGTQEMMYYDFWAVGVDCCKGLPDGPTAPKAGVAPNYYCGQFNNPRARAGLRMMSDAQRPFYKLATDQAKAAYGFTVTHPLFFYWVQDPINGNTGYSSGSYYPYDTASMQTTSGNQFGLGTNGGFLGLWPFTWSDFGLGGLTIGSGGMTTLIKRGQQLMTMGFAAFCLLHLVLTVCATCSFAALGFPDSWYSAY